MLFPHFVPIHNFSCLCEHGSFIAEQRKDEDYDEDVEENLLDEVHFESALFIFKKLNNLKSDLSQIDQIYLLHSCLHFLLIR